MTTQITPRRGEIRNTKEKMKLIRFNSKQLEKIYNRGYARSRRVEERVRQIIDDVRLAVLRSFKV